MPTSRQDELGREPSSRCGTLALRGQSFVTLLLPTAERVLHWARSVLGDASAGAQSQRAARGLCCEREGRACCGVGENQLQA